MCLLNIEFRWRDGLLYQVSFGFFNLKFDFDGASLKHICQNNICQILCHIYLTFDKSYVTFIQKPSEHFKIKQSAYFIHMLPSRASMNTNC